jgi:biotin carboxyl carrier protein
VRFEAEVDGQRVAVEVRGQAGRYEVTIGERHRLVDARATSAQTLSVLVDGESHDVGLERATDGFVVRLAGASLNVRLTEASAASPAPPAATGPARIVAPMPGKIVRVLAAEGETVEAGSGLIVVEAMKMENELRAARRGRVHRIHVREGQAVEGGALLVELE